MREQVELSMFDGGWNSTVNLIDCPTHQSPEMWNIAYDDYGAIKGFKGIATLNSDPLASSPEGRIVGFASYTPNTMSAQMLAVCDGTVYVATGAATAFNAIASSASVYSALTTRSSQVNILQFKDLAIFTGYDIEPYKFNGNEFTRLGMSAPSTVLTSQINAAGGNLIGDYNYVYTPVNSYSAEGDYGSASVTLAASAGGESLRVGSIPTAPASTGIESWNVYRNETSGTVYYKVTNISNGVTSFTDDVADTDLVTEAPSDNGSPRLFEFTAQYLGRLWGAGESTNPDYLWFSKVNEPYLFPSTNRIPVGEGDGMNITGIAVQNGIITISKADHAGKSAIYLLYVGDPTTSSDPANWFLTKADSDYGSYSHRAMKTFKNKLVLVNNNGFYGLQGRSITLSPSETTKGQLVTEKMSFDMEKTLKAYNWLNPASAYVEMVDVIDWNSKLWFAIEGVTAPTPLWIYDYNTMAKGNRKGGAWSYIYYDSADPTIRQFAVHESELYGCDNLNGYIYKLDNGYNEGTGKAITTYYVTAPFKGKKEHEKLWKDFINCWIEVEGGGSYNMSFQHSCDSGSYSTAQNVALTTTLTNKKVEFTNSGYYLQMKFSMNTADQYFIIRKITYEYVPRGMRN